jgi:hypothetical protein
MRSGARACEAAVQGASPTPLPYPWVDGPHTPRAGPRAFRPKTDEIGERRNGRGAASLEACNRGAKLRDVSQFGPWQGDTPPLPP